MTASHGMLVQAAGRHPHFKPRNCCSALRARVAVPRLAFGRCCHTAALPLLRLQPTRATRSDGDSLPETDSIDFQGIEQLASTLSSAAASMKIDELEAQAKAAVKEADLLEGRALAVELEAERLEAEVAQRIANEEDERKKMIHARMLSVARLDAKEQRAFADAIRSVADKAVAQYEEARDRRA